MGIKITAYHYNTLCDTYGCSGMARVSLAMEDTPGSLKHNICNDCLEGIVAAAPPHMVFAREDVQAYVFAEMERAMTEVPMSVILKKRKLQEDPDTFTATSIEESAADVESDTLPADIEDKLEQFHQKITDAYANKDTFTAATVVSDAEIAELNKGIIPKDTAYSLLFDDDAAHVKPGETALIKSYNWQDLKKLAKDLKIEGCNSMKRDVLEAEILKRL